MAGLIEKLATDVLTLADAGGMPDTFKVTDARVGRALDALKERDADVPPGWEQIARQRAEAGEWSAARAAEQAGA
jgi:hypothetical protein